MRSLFWAGVAMAAMIALPACSERAENKVENAGAAIGQDIDNNLDAAGARIDSGLDQAGATIENGAARVGDAADDAAADAKREASETKKDVGGAMERAGRDLKNEN